MTIIHTASGKAIDLLVIDASQLCIRDIAYSLSNINRFYGHTLRPISVAEHSLIVCEIMARHFGITSPSVLLAALLHDAHEALVGDVAQPVKQLLGPAWRDEEDRIQRVVLKRFGVYTAFVTHRHEIHDADMHALTSEREQLIHPDAQDVWPCQVTHPALDWVRYGSASQFSPDDWRHAFFARYQELTSALSLQHSQLKTA